MNALVDVDLKLVQHRGDETPQRFGVLADRIGNLDSYATHWLFPSKLIRLLGSAPSI